MADGGSSQTVGAEAGVAHREGRRPARGAQATGGPSEEEGRGGRGRGSGGGRVEGHTSELIRGRLPGDYSAFNECLSFL